MTWPFENNTNAITEKIAKNDIDKNRVKKVFSLTTIVFATALVLIILTITISAFYSLQKTPLVERLRIID